MPANIATFLETSKEKNKKMIKAFHFFVSFPS